MKVNYRGSWAPVGSRVQGLRFWVPILGLPAVLLYHVMTIAFTIVYEYSLDTPIFHSYYDLTTHK